MRAFPLLLALIGCAPDPPADAEPSSEFCCRVPQAQLEITKHVRDGERYERAGRFEDAEREFWFAELKLFGLRDWGMRELATYVRQARLRVRSLRPPAGG